VGLILLKVSSVAVALLYTFLAAYVFVYGRLDVFLPEPVRYLALLGIVGLSVVGLGLAVLVRAYGAAVLTLFVFFYVLLSMLVFQQQFGTAISFGPVSNFAPVLSVGLFAFFATSLGMERLLAVIFRVAIIYAATYIAVTLMLRYAPQLIPASANNWLVTFEDPTRPGARDPRVVSITMLLTFGIFYSLRRLQAGWNKQDGLLFSLFLYCLWVANARTLAVSIIAVAMLYLVFKSERRTFAFCAAVFVFVCVWFVVSIEFGWNAYEFFRGDVTGIVRYYSFETAAYFVNAMPYFGTGLAPGREQEIMLSSNVNFYAVDIGPAGIAFMYGYVGLTLWILTAILPFVFNRRNGKVLGAVTLTIAVAVLYQSTAPVMWNGGGTLFAAIWIISAFRLSVGRPELVPSAAKSPVVHSGATG
jgi:hypothetical protein